jgi:hypothetical protein
MKAIGIVLIVFGVLAGASGVSMNMTPEAQRLPPAERLGQAVGGVLITLTLIGVGFLFVNLGDKKPKGRDERDQSEESGEPDTTDGS